MSPKVKCPQCGEVFRIEGSDFAVPDEPALDFCFFCGRSINPESMEVGKKGAICRQCVALCRSITSTKETNKKTSE
jgi:hypothetical protein